MIDTALTVSDLEVGYGKKTVVFGVDFDIPKGKIIAILGHNGAGKSTTLMAVSGLLEPSCGRVVFNGEEVTRLPCAERARRGLAMIPAEHFTFAPMTVLDNIRLGGRMVGSPEVKKARLQRCFELFPILRDRWSQKAGTLSGGQQRMLSIAIVLMLQPGLLMLDEPSLGLAPAVAYEIMEVIRRLVEEDGLAVLFVEQNIPLALKFADHVHIMRSGRLIVSQTAEQLSKHERLWDLF